MSSPSPSTAESEPQSIAYLDLKLREIGQPGVATARAGDLAPLVDHLLALSREKDRALTRHLAPVDQRIQNFLYDHFEEHGPVPRLLMLLRTADETHLDVAEAQSGWSGDPTVA